MRGAKDFTDNVSETAESARSGSADAEAQTANMHAATASDTAADTAADTEVDVPIDGEPTVSEGTDSMSGNNSAVEGASEAAVDDLAAAQAQAAAWQDKFMRLHAEWDTYRRRMNEQRDDERKRATEKLVGDLLPVLDDFERSIDYAQNNGESDLLDGVQKVHTKLVDVLVKCGVEVIDPVGEAFNALEAQAVATVERTDIFDETVQDVYQKGYKMGRKVIRPAMVTVTSGGPKREKEDPLEETEDFSK